MKRYILLTFIFMVSTWVNILAQDIDMKVEIRKSNTSEFSSDIIITIVEGQPDFNVYPCRGEYLVLDKNYSYLINAMIYPVPPKEMGVLGVHITPTIEGNILLGPSAEFITDKNDNITTNNMMKILLKVILDYKKNCKCNPYR